MNLLLHAGELYCAEPVEWARSDITLKKEENRVVARLFEHEISKGVRFFVIKGDEFLKIDPNSGALTGLKSGDAVVRAVFGDWHLEINLEIVQPPWVQTGLGRPSGGPQSDPDLPTSA